MKKCCEDYLREQFGGDADIMNEIYAEYVASIGEKLKEADEHLAAGAWQPLDHVAHTIKGNALASGDNEMAETAIALRSAAKLNDSEQAATLIANLKGLAAQL